MHRYKVLIVDDDPKFVEDMASSLSDELDVVGETSAFRALSLIQKTEFDAVTVDILMPGLDGYGFFKLAKAAKPEMPCIFLTQLVDDNSFVNAMDLGPDDFVTKPVTPTRLSSVLRNRIRKRRPVEESVIAFRELKMDLVSGRCLVGENSVDLTKTEWQILLHLVRNQERRSTRDEVFGLVWRGRWVSRHTLDTHVANLRQKLKRFGIEIAYESNAYQLTSK